VRIHSLADIRRVLPQIDLVELMAGAFAAYSEGRAVVAPVVELPLERGDVHIKSGFLSGEDLYVVKIASGFYDNPALGLPSGHGMMLLFEQKTGLPAAILLDEGHLTDIRTAAAGAVAARELAPANVDRIAIFGTGIQARQQLAHLRTITPCRRVIAWGRGEAQLASYAEDASTLGFEVETTLDASLAAQSAQLLVTTTPATAPLFPADAVRPGSHVTAVGSDTPTKQELDPQLLAKAGRIVADSLPQALLRGEIFQALSAELITETDVAELGDVIAGRTHGREDREAITIADLTGVAVQDVEIARAVSEALA